MGAAEYFERIKAQNKGESQPKKAGAAEYFARKREEALKPQGEVAPSIEPNAPDEPEPTEPFNYRVITEGLKKGAGETAAVMGYIAEGGAWLMDNIPGLDMDKNPLGGAKMIREGFDLLLKSQLNRIPGVEMGDEPVGSSAMIQKGWNLLLDHEPQTPKTTTEKYASKISEFVGGSIVMGPSLINKTLGAQTTWREMNRRFLLEGAAAVSGGAMAQWQGDLFAEAFGEEFRGLAEFSGGLSGATGVQLLVSGLKRRGLIIDPLMKALRARGMDDIRAIFDDYGGAYTRNRAKNKIISAIGDSPSSSKNMDRAIGLGEEIENFKPTATQASGSEALAQLQNSVDTKSVESINRGIKAELANKEAVYSYYRDYFPEAEVKEFTAKKVFKQTSNAIRQEIAAIERKSSSLAQAHQRQPTEVGGSRLVALAKEKMGVVKKAKDGKYEELYASADRLKVFDDVSDVRKLVNDIQADDQYLFDNFPGVHKKIKSLLNAPIESASGLIELPPGASAKPTDNISSFRKIHSLSREINREYGIAMRANDGAKMFHLKGLQNVLDDKLAKFDDATYGNFGNQKKAVDKFYREEYLNVFKKGVGKDIIGIGAKDSTPEGLIIRKKILISGSSRGLDQFNKLYGDVPEAQLLLRNGIMDEFSRVTVNKGQLSRASIDTFMKDYREVLDKLPDVKAVFSQTDTMLTSLAERSQKLKARHKLFTTDSASSYAKVAGFDDLESAAEYALSNKESMRILLRSMKDSTAKEGLASVFADRVMSQKDPWGFIKKNEATLKPVFNQLKPGHYKNLKNVAEAMDILNRHSTLLRVNPGKQAADGLEEMIGTSVPSAFAQIRWATLYNKTSEAYVAVGIGSKYLYKLKQDNFERLIEESLYEPDLAKLLSDISTQEATALSPGILNRLGQYAIKMGIRSAETTMRRGIVSATIAADQEQQANTP